MLVSFPHPQMQRSNGSKSIFKVEHTIGMYSDEITVLMLR